MKIRYTKRFKKDIISLSVRQKYSVASALRVFATNPYYPALRNHKLSGKLKGTRAISAGYDLRIVYREERGHAVIVMLRVGTHRKVYVAK